MQSLAAVPIFYSRLEFIPRGYEHKGKNRARRFSALGVSEFGDGTPWISTEPRRQDMPFLKHALLGFDLPKGTTLDKAHEIADFMNKNLGEVSVTIFGEHRMF